MSNSESITKQKFKLLHGYSNELESELNELAETNFVKVHKMYHAGGASIMLLELESYSEQNKPNPFNKGNESQGGGFLLH